MVVAIAYVCRRRSNGQSNTLWFHDDFGHPVATVVQDVLAEIVDALVDWLVPGRRPAPPLLGADDCAATEASA